MPSLVFEQCIQPDREHLWGIDANLIKAASMRLFKFVLPDPIAKINRIFVRKFSRIHTAANHFLGQSSLSSW